MVNTGPGKEIKFSSKSVLSFIMYLSALDIQSDRFLNDKESFCKGHGNRLLVLRDRF